MPQPALFLKELSFFGQEPSVKISICCVGVVLVETVLEEVWLSGWWKGLKSVQNGFFYYEKWEKCITVIDRRIVPRCNGILRIKPHQITVADSLSTFGPRRGQSNCAARIWFHAAPSSPRGAEKRAFVLHALQFEAVTAEVLFFNSGIYIHSETILFSFSLTLSYNNSSCAFLD